MKSEKNWQSKHGQCCVLIVLTVLLLLGMLFSGCTTVTPRIPQSNAPSWDGTNQNSGFIGWSGNQGIITPHARDRYNSLISVYSKRFLPPLTPDYGITATSSNVFLITPEALADFVQMNRWKKFDAGKISVP